MRLYAVLSAILLVLVAILWRVSQPVRPDPRMVALAVRATVYALPTPTLHVLEVTRVVEVTRLVEAAAPTATATLTPTLAPTAEAASGALAPEASVSEVEPAPDPMLMAASADVTAKAAPVELQPDTRGLDVAVGTALTAQESAEEQVTAPEALPADAEAVSAPEVAAETMPADDGGACPSSSSNQYTTIPVAGDGLAFPDGQHGDLNLALRGYAPVNVAPGLMDKDGPVDSDPPQLAGMFAGGRLPGFGQPYQVFDWNWGCGGQGCRGELLSLAEATLLEMQTNRGETIGIPHRNAQVYAGGFVAMVLYAEPTRITLVYTREDSVANGYVVHIENVCVDPNLLTTYQGSNSSGRASLPALHNEDILGTAGLGNIAVAIRDRGVFFDPRSRLDWWQGY